MKEQQEGKETEAGEPARQRGEELPVTFSPVSRGTL